MVSEMIWDVAAVGIAAIPIVADLSMGHGFAGDSQYAYTAAYALAGAAAIAVALYLGGGTLSWVAIGIGLVDIVNGILGAAGYAFL